MQRSQIEHARPREPATHSAVEALRTLALPDELGCAKDYEQLNFAIFSIVRGIDSDYALFLQSGFLNLSGDAAAAAAATQLEERLDTYAQNHARTMVRAAKFVLNGVHRQLSFELLVFYASCMCSLNRQVHTIKARWQILSTLCTHNIPYAQANKLSQSTVPILQMSARELIRTFRQIERRFTALEHAQEFVDYIDLLRFRAAMLMRTDYPFEVFDADEYARALPEQESQPPPASSSASDAFERPMPVGTAAARAAVAAAAPARAERYIFSRRFLEDACWFFGAVDARLFTAVLWPRRPVAQLFETPSLAAAHESAAAPQHGGSGARVDANNAQVRARLALLGARFVLAERAERMRAFLSKTGATLSVELVNAGFRERYLAHSLLLSERRRFMRDKPHAQISQAKIIKEFRGLDAINALLVLADTDAPEALSRDKTPFANDPVAIDLMQMRVIDAYCQSFFDFSLEERYVYYAGEVLEGHGAIQNTDLPLFVQAFTRFDLYVEGVLYVCADFAEAFTAWLAYASVFCARAPGKVQLERLYTAAWGSERPDFTTHADSSTESAGALAPVPPRATTSATGARIYHASI